MFKEAAFRLITAVGPGRSQVFYHGGAEARSFEFITELTLSIPVIRPRPPKIGRSEGFDLLARAKNVPPMKCFKLKRITKSRSDKMENTFACSPLNIVC